MGFVGMVGLSLRTVGKVCSVALSTHLGEQNDKIASVFISRALSHLYKKNLLPAIDRRDLLLSKPNLYL